MVMVSELAKFQLKRSVPEFSVGDTVKVSVKILEGDKERIQVFEGVVIAKKMRGVESMFTVRKVSYGEGVERTFPLHSPRVESIKVTRRGEIRRARLYYLRARSNKDSRIKEIQKK